MQKRNSAIIIVAIVVVIVAGATIIAALLGGNTGNPQAAGESEASSTVASFGAALQQVSLLSPDASSTMASAYGPYVDPTLLHQWQKDPSSAPGRVVSSPWPDHINVATVSPQGAGYVVNGQLVFMTSTGPDTTTPIVIQLAPVNGKLMIVAFQSQKQK